MARKIGLLDPYQPDHATPKHHVRKVLAELMVRRLLWEWVIRNHIARVKPLGALPAVIPRAEAAPRGDYIPETLPPAELGGYRFRGPQPTNPHMRRLCRLTRYERDRSRAIDALFLVHPNCVSIDTP
jgi:hypothetical protein